MQDNLLTSKHVLSLGFLKNYMSLLKDNIVNTGFFIHIEITFFLLNFQKGSVIIFMYTFMNINCIFNF